MEDIEKRTYPINLLISSPSLSPSLVKRIKDLGNDKDGCLSAEELLLAFQQEEEAVEDRQTFRRITTFLLIGLVILLASLAGAIYALVKQNQDITVSTGTGQNYLTASNGGILETGTARNQTTLDSLYNSGSILPVLTLDKIIVNDNKNGTQIASLTVTSVQVTPNVSAIINTTSGIVIIADANGVRPYGNLTLTGRRLLCHWYDVVCWGEDAYHQAANLIDNTIIPDATNAWHAATGYITQHVGSGMTGDIVKGLQTVWQDFNHILPNVGSDSEIAYVKAKADAIASCVSNPVANYQSCIPFLPCSSVGTAIYDKCKADPNCVKSASGFGSSVFQSIKDQFDTCISGSTSSCLNLYKCISSGYSLVK